VKTDEGKTDVTKDIAFVPVTQTHTQGDQQSTDRGQGTVSEQLLMEDPSSPSAGSLY